MCYLRATWPKVKWHSTGRAGVKTHLYINIKVKIAQQHPAFKINTNNSIQKQSICESCRPISTDLKYLIWTFHLDGQFANNYDQLYFFSWYYNISVRMELKRRTSGSMKWSAKMFDPENVPIFMEIILSTVKSVRKVSEDIQSWSFREESLTINVCTQLHCAQPCQSFTLYSPSTFCRKLHFSCSHHMGNYPSTAFSWRQIHTSAPALHTARFSRVPITARLHPGVFNQFI